jgi:hypothetical protein
VLAAEVSGHERVPGLRLLGSALGEADVPFGVLAPRVIGEKRVLVLGFGLDDSPVAVQHILAPRGVPRWAVSSRSPGRMCSPGRIRKRFA